MTQVFARYAKDLLEKQTYPEVRRTPTVAARAALRRHRVVARHADGRRRRVREEAAAGGGRSSTQARRRADARRRGDRERARVSSSTTGAPTRRLAINRLLKDGAHGRLRANAAAAQTVVVDGRAAQDAWRRWRPNSASRCKARRRAEGRGGQAGDDRAQGAARRALPAVDRQHGRGLDALGARAVGVRADDAAQRRRQGGQAPPAVRRHRARRPAAARHPRGQRRRAARRPEYRGGIGEEGVQALKAFVADGGTLVMMGNACDLAIEKCPIPVRNLKRGPDARPALRAGHDRARAGRHRAARSASACRPTRTASTSTARSST